MDFREKIKDKILLLDGAMGTMIQKYIADPGRVPELLSITHADEITKIQNEYASAGADILYTNTFGASKFKMEGTGVTAAEAVAASVENARRAGSDDTMVAVDIGPLGQLLEPMGTLTFEEAYDSFKEVAVQGEKSGADLAVIETMTDLYEVKAALLAVKENTSLPVIVSMTFGEDGRTFTGCGIEEMALLLESLGADAAGINCSLGPDEIFPLAEKLCACTELPVFIKPNAGLPDPRTGAYDISADEFAESMEKYMDIGVCMIGGCCGTTPEYTKKMKVMLEGRAPSKRAEREKKTAVCTATRICVIDHTTVIGERLNPTGKPRLRDAIKNGDYDYIMKQAVEEAEEGADILDVNAGVPGIDEAAVLPQMIKKIQSVTDIPLQIDSGNAKAVEAALRVYNGKAIVNSVNGTEKSISEILPAVRHYGAAAVGLTLDDDGIPKTAEGRYAVAKKIRGAANKAGVPDSDLIIDCLTLTASAEQEGAEETLKAISLVKEKLGLRTVLGVSNISFGLPNRPIINRAFLTMALERGLDCAIMDPGDEGMMGAVSAFEMLRARDRNAVKFISRFGGAGRESAGPRGSAGCDDAERKERRDVGEVSFADVTADLRKGLSAMAADDVRTLLAEYDEICIVNRYLVPALDIIGQEFEEGTLYLPQMMQAATAAQAGFDVLKDNMSRSGRKQISKGDVVMATVKGDIHDIGKNIVKTIMDNYGYHVIDLGRDVDPSVIVDTVVENDIRLVGLSALMTTTLDSMEETIAEVKAAKPDCSVMIGGAVITPEYAKDAGADHYCKDAMQAVSAARAVFGE